jgi:serine/threonine-protein kinase
MQVLATEDLISALRGSGLFGDEQIQGIVRDLAPLGDSLAMMRRLLASRRLTRYQLKKVVHGKAAELRVGPYVITDKLGEGGMGKVYRARRGAGGPEPLALKVVRPALVANPVVRGRYAREVQAAGTLDHPNIVRLFDAGEDAGRFYLAMEFVDGIDLARMMQHYGRLEAAEACEYARQAALGLAHAHAKGFVHRDIKPSNVVVAGERHLPQAGEPAVVKLLDLGLARAIDPDDMVAPNLTRDHTVVGTPDYMAPEQARDSKHPDPRSDLYSLGCAFYVLLTGQVPFPRGGAIEKIIAHQSQPPAPVQSLRPDVPAELAALVAKLLAKRPEDRVQTAGGLAELLAPFARYPAGAAPVEVSVRDSAPHAPASSASGVCGPAVPAPSTSSLLGPVTLLELAKEEPPAVAPSDRTPRPKADSPKESKRLKQSARPAARQSKLAQPTARKSRIPAADTRRRVPQIIWVAFAIFGAAVLALMLWLAAHP